ncbi:MAG: T9SS type A sorting domain-containing protein [Bacteroidota bacterium]
MFEEPPYLTGEVGQLCTYHPIPIDDASFGYINYDHIVPRMGVDMPVPNYVYPNDISPGSNNALNVDHWFGLMTWEAPQEACRYMITYRVTELLTQNDIKASVIRNVLIDVYDTGNQIPEIIVDTTEVYLPDLFGVYTKELTATDVDQEVLLEGYGSFLADPLATFTAPIEFSTDTAIGSIAITGGTEFCSSVAAPCKLILRATDNFSSTNPGTRFQYFTFAYGPQVSSFERESSSNTLALYPNPTHAWVEVRLPENRETGTLEIYAPVGQRVEQQLIPEGQDLVQLDTQLWPPGIYWVVWKEGKKALRASLVKQ